MAKRKAAAPLAPRLPRKRLPAVARRKSAERQARRAGATHTGPPGRATCGREEDVKPAKKKKAAPKARPAAAAKNEEEDGRPTPTAAVKTRRNAPPVHRRAAPPAGQVATPCESHRGKIAPLRRPRTARLDRVRRTLEESGPRPAEMVPTPPSSLDLDRHASAARTGTARDRRGAAQSRIAGDLTRGDVDADAENAYFSGDEAPGGDNPTPDQDIVDDIGKAIGVQYQDNEELRASDKVIERDRHRWELDPASSEDYKERK